MINLGMSIFDLAYLQLRREGKLKKKNWIDLWFNRAIKIRKYLDMVERNKKVVKNRKKRRHENEMQDL
mgnify:CR=1 FL=1